MVDKQQLQQQLDHCEASMKGFSGELTFTLSVVMATCVVTIEQLRKDTTQQQQQQRGVSNDHKSISLPNLNGM